KSGRAKDDECGMRGRRMRGPLAALLDRAELVDGALGYCRAVPAPAEGVRDDERLRPEQECPLPRRQGEVASTHRLAELPHCVFDPGEDRVIADRLAPIKIELIPLEREFPAGVVLAHGVEEEHVVDELCLGGIVLLAGVSLLVEE